MANNSRLKMDIFFDPEELDGEWAFHVRDLGITLYGDSKEEGQRIVRRAVNVLFDSFGEDSDALLRYLGRRGAEYQIVRQRAHASTNENSGVVRLDEALVGSAA